MSGNLYDASAAGMQQAGNRYGDIAAGGMPAVSMNAYLNPYQSQVIGDTVSRMQDAHTQTQMQVGDAALAAGAFGGARHGLVEAENTSNFMRNLGEQVSRMNQSGFNTALNAGFQDVNQQMQAAAGLGNLSNNAVQIGRQLTSDQLAQGGLQQQLMQMILGGAANQFGQYLDYPHAANERYLSQLGANPLMGENTQQQTQQYKPGLFDYLSLGMQTAGRIGAGAFGG